MLYRHYLSTFLTKDALIKKKTTKQKSCYIESQQEDAPTTIMSRDRKDCASKGCQTYHLVQRKDSQGLIWIKVLMEKYGMYNYYINQGSTLVGGRV